VTIKIDFFNHFFPKAFYDKYINAGAHGRDMGKRVQNIPAIADLDARLKALDEFGNYVQVLTMPVPPLEVLGGPGRTPGLAREANDGLAELVEKQDRFIAFGAALPMNDPDAAVRELIRACDDLGAAGVQLHTNVGGKPLDLPEFRPIFDEIARRKKVIWLHPSRDASVPDYSTEEQSLYEIWWTFGWPYETSVAMSRLVFTGLFDRHPGIRIVTHHMGAMIPYFTGRVGYGWDQLGTRTSDKDYGALLASMKKRPIDYFRSFFADTALFGGIAGMRCGLDFFGVDQVLFASDMPFEPSPGLYARETILGIEQLGLNAEQKQKIYSKNAKKLLNL
jgi:predicted TIM-barrel fold metal-dependent hydrolase